LSSSSSQLRGAATVGYSRPRSEAFGHRGGDQLGHRRFQLLGNAFGQYHRAATAHRFVQRTVEVQALTSAGQRKRGQPDVGDQISDGAGHFGELSHRHALTRVEIEHQAGGRARLELLALTRPLGSETPLRHMHFQRGLLGDPSQTVDAVDDRVGRRAGSMRDAAARQPLRRRSGKLLFEKRGLLHSVGPSLTGGRPSGDVRHHHLGNTDVIIEDVGFGGSGGGVQHLVGVGQLHPRRHGVNLRCR